MAVGLTNGINEDNASVFRLGQKLYDCMLELPIFIYPGRQQEPVTGKNEATMQERRSPKG